MSLSDAALIKDNHIAAAGGVTEAFSAVRSAYPEAPIEIEVDTLDQLREVLPLGEISLCTLVPEGLPDQLITLNLTGRVLHRLGAGPGQWVQLELAPEALHIMPVR